MAHGGLNGMQYHTWLAYLHLNNETRVQKPEIYRNSREYGSSVIPATEGEKKHARRKLLINLAMPLNSTLKNKVKSN